MNRFQHKTSAGFVLFLLILTVALPVHAEFEWGAKYAGDFLTGQSNARLLALGGVGVAIADGPSALLANPAAIFNSRMQSVSLMHADRFESAVKMDYANFVYNEDNQRAMGFGLIRQGVDDIPITRLENPSLPISQDNRVRVLEYSGASEYAFNFAYALKKSYGQVGANAKLLYKHLHENNGFGLGFDIGYLRKMGNLTVGAQFRDVLMTVLTWDTGRQEAIAPTARLGAAYLIHAPRLLADILPVVELQFRGESLGDDDFVVFHGGLEYTIQKVVSARVGVDDKKLTYGAGLNVGPVVVDYAFIGHEDLGNTHRVSIGYTWGKEF